MKEPFHLVSSGRPWRSRVNMELCPCIFIYLLSTQSILSRQLTNPRLSSTMDRL